jgi:hypothetical protein
MEHGTKRSGWIWGLAWLALLACQPKPAADQDAASDVTRPRAEQLDPFRAGLLEATALTGGTASRDELVRQWVAAVATADTTTVRQLLLSRAEFAWLFYPTTAQALPPYDLPPGLLWDMLSRQSNAGMEYVFRRWNDRELQLESYDCGTEPVAEGNNLIHGPCVMRIIVAGSETVAARLTGPILERAGRFKFVSYTNDLD